MIEPLAKVFAAFLFLNEIRGIVFTAPVFYALYQSGGTLLAIWMAVCALGGILLSVLVPLFAAKKIKAWAEL